MAEDFNSLFFTRLQIDRALSTVEQREAYFHGGTCRCGDNRRSCTDSPFQEQSTPLKLDFRHDKTDGGFRANSSFGASRD